MATATRTRSRKPSPKDVAEKVQPKATQPDVEQPEPEQPTEPQAEPETEQPEQSEEAAKTVKASKPKIEVTDADVAKLTVVAKHQKSPVRRHLAPQGEGNSKWVCPHFDLPGKQEFVPASEEQLKLKGCPDCASKAARIRIAAEAATAA